MLHRYCLSVFEGVRGNLSDELCKLCGRSTLKIPTMVLAPKVHMLDRHNYCSLFTQLANKNTQRISNCNQIKCWPMCWPIHVKSMPTAGVECPLLALFPFPSPNPGTHRSALKYIGDSVLGAILPDICPAFLSAKKLPIIGHWTPLKHDCHLSNLRSERKCDLPEVEARCPCPCSCPCPCPCLIDDCNLLSRVGRR